MAVSEEGSQKYSTRNAANRAMADGSPRSASRCKAITASE
jgi:hypothetical protein